MSLPIGGRRAAYEARLLAQGSPAKAGERATSGRMGLARRLLTRGAASARRSSPGHRYLVALVLAAAGLGVSLALRDATGGALSPLLAAVALAIWICGAGPAVAAFVAVSLGSWFLLLDPPFSGHVADRHDVWRWVLFVVVSALLVGLGHRVRIERERDRVAWARDRDARILVDRLRLHARAIAAESTPERVAQETMRVLVDAGMAFVRIEAVRDGMVFALAAHGPTGEESAGPGGYPVGEDRTALAEVLRTGDGLALPDAAAAERHPEVARLRRLLGAATGVVLPLRVPAGGVRGALTAFLAAEAWPEGLAEFVGAVAEQCSVALDRALTVAAETRTHTRAQLAARLVDAMETASTMRGVAQVLADVLVPRVADYAWVEFTGMGASLAVAAHSDPKWAHWLRANPPTPSLRPVPWSSLAAVMVTDQAQILDETPIVEQRAGTGAAFPTDDLWVAHSRVAVPLRLSDGQGVIVLGLQDPARRPYAPDDVAFLEELGGRAAPRLDNASLQEQAQDVARRLQLALLPTRLADTRGMQVAASYHPGAHELHVGGDWYDAIEVSPTRVVYTVGDVVGKGVGAAAVMGRIRSALRALAHRCTDPADALRTLAAYATAIDGAEFATVTYCDLDLTSGRLRYLHAGHPPVLVIDPDDGPFFLEDGRTTPLLVSAPTPAVPAERILKPGTTLLFYSDGLVERRGSSLLTRLEHLRQTAGELAEAPLSAVPERIVSALVQGPPTDDVVVLAARYDGVVAERFERSYLATPAVLAVIRNDLRAWLRDRGVERGDEDAIVLAASEACANAAEHAYADHDMEGFVAVAASWASDEVLITIRDDGAWRSASNGADRGRGTSIMEALADDVERSTGPAGTTVTLRKRVRVPVAP